MRFLLALLGAAALTTAAAAQAPQEHTSGTFNMALGVSCDHCHVLDRWDDRSKPTLAFSRRMIGMVDQLNAGPLQPLGGITCWTCHRGSLKPARLPRESWEAMAEKHADVFQGPRAALRITMSVAASSLGVECTHCHQAGAFEAETKPQKATARVMFGMFAGMASHFDKAERMPVFQCFSCHQGSVKPAR